MGDFYSRKEICESLSWVPSQAGSWWRPGCRESVA